MSTTGEEGEREVIRQLVFQIYRDWIKYSSGKGEAANRMSGMRRAGIARQCRVRRGCLTTRLVAGCCAACGPNKKWYFSSSPQFEELILRLPYYHYSPPPSISLPHSTSTSLHVHSIQSIRPYSTFGRLSDCIAIAVLHCSVTQSIQQYQRTLKELTNNQQPQQLSQDPFS